ncbi:unnamed protein product [Boreogadus saida]
MVRIQELLLTLQPGEGGAVAGIQPDPSLGDVPGTDDVLSLAASANLFSEGVTEEETSNTFGEASRSSAQSSGHSIEGNPMGAVILTALARLGLDAPQADLDQPSAFFRCSPATSPFSVPPSEEYLKELHVCWKDAKALPRPPASAQALAAMRDPALYGLGRMPPIEPAIASLILTPDQALRPDARINITCLSLQAFALMSRELGRVMSTLVQTRRQVWLAQSPLTEACRKALRAVPVIPGELFGSAALETLERAAQARQTNLQLSGLHRSVSAPGRPRVPPAAPRGRSQSRSYLARDEGLLPTEAGGPGARTTGLVVGCFSQQKLSYWAACTIDPWVVSTLTRGAGRRLIFIQFLQLSGKLAAASAVVPLGLLSLRPLQMWLNSLHLDATGRGGSRRDLLSQLGGQIWHPDLRRLQLWAWPLQGPTHC